MEECYVCVKVAPPTIGSMNFYYSIKVWWGYVCDFPCDLRYILSQGVLLSLEVYKGKGILYTSHETL